LDVYTAIKRLYFTIKNGDKTFNHGDAALKDWVHHQELEFNMV